MPVPPSPYQFTTGPTSLPDIGKLSYNGCRFSPLFETNVAGVVVKDNAQRTTKFMEYTITADGYVTLPDDQYNRPDGFGSIADEMKVLRELLTAQGGMLQYTGRGNDIVVNAPGGTVRDVAWGPVPEILDFQPLGAGRSAKIRWQVKTRIPEVTAGRRSVLQFNCDTAVVYNEDGYSGIVIRGTLEIPLTRATQQTRTLTTTVDDFRQAWLDDVANSIDLTRFRIVRRDFNVSRDKRTMEWIFSAEELPYMAMPPDVTVARGTFDVKPSKSGMGLANWQCTLRCTYNVRKDKPRRIAWEAFLALVRVRMGASMYAIVPPPSNQNSAAPSLISIAVGAGPSILPGLINPMQYFRDLHQSQNAIARAGRRAWVIDFNISEGMYLESKTVTFSITWRLITVFNRIILASGLWRQVDPVTGVNNYAISMRDISGWRGVLPNRLNASQDVIVDFGGSN